MVDFLSISSWAVTKGIREEAGWIHSFVKSVYVETKRLNI
jgi:hypothetical protein